VSLRDQIYPTKRALSLGYHRPPDDPAKRSCRWCGGAVPKGRRSWCSQRCVDEALMVAQPGFARRKVEERDHGVCSACGIDCGRLERLVERLGKLARAIIWVRAADQRPVASYWDPQPDGARVVQVQHPAATKAMANLEIALALLSLWAGHDVRKWCGSWNRGEGRREWWSLKHSLWQADHIKPVVEGGGGCGLYNYRTLCLRCHKGATAELAHRRRRQKELF
jgi:5-methylcytosine-specific restriction enzyme A